MNEIILKRNLGVMSLVVYYFSTIVGVGIFIVPILAAKIAGPASLISWLLVLCCTYPFAMIFANISQRYQVSGSIQKFLEDEWGKKLGQALALFLVISALFGNALLGFSAAKYCNEFLDTTYNVYMLGLAFLIIPTFFNLLNVGLSSKIQTICLILLVILVEFIVISSIGDYKMGNLTPFMPNGASSIGLASVICLYAVVGWENVDAMAEEVKEPVKTYIKAAKIAILLIAFFYLSIAFTVVMVLDYQSLSSSTTVLTSILNLSFGAIASKFACCVAMVLLVLGANAWTFGTSRIIFALSREGILPKSLKKLSSNHVPHLAVIWQLLPYSIIVLVFILFQLEEDLVVEITSVNYLLLYSIIFLGAVRVFTTRRLKFLSTFALFATIILLMQSPLKTISISLGLLSVCYVYIKYHGTKNLS